jgi:2-polyprenyl-3-methyl-5-hydroxy-6-metoxy-1,4-benzoquinol methylase
VTRFRLWGISAAIGQVPIGPRCTVPVMDARDWDERYLQKEYVWTAEPNRFVVEAVGGLEPGTALDLAAGEGRNSVWLASQGWDVTAVDWSQVAIDKARDLAERSGATGIEFRVEDLLSWSPPVASYDLVLIVYLQIPHHEREDVWRRAAAAVRPGGHLVVIGHDSDNLEHGYGGPQHPAVLYTADEVVAVLTGLEILRAEQVIRVVENGDGRHEAIDNMVVAVRS